MVAYTPQYEEKASAMMESDNPPGRNARHPDTEADYADDADASAFKIESSKAEKDTTGVAVGNKKDDAEVEADPPNTNISASQSKIERKAKKKTTGLALAPVMKPHDPGRREVCTPDGVTRAKVIAKKRRRHRKNRRERQAFAEEEKTEIVDLNTQNYRATRLDEEEEEGELEDDYDTYVPPGALRMGGTVTTIILLLQTKQNHWSLFCLSGPRPQQPCSRKRSSPRMWTRKSLVRLVKTENAV
jgi:hypothetical protein